MNKFKKIFVTLFVFTLLSSLVGCSMGNTPTKKVENFLDKYNRNDEIVTSQLQEMLNSDGLMTEDQKKAYKDIIQKQYKDMTYTVKNEKIEGNKATVTAEIEVYDFYKANKEAEDYYNNNKNEFIDSTKQTINETSNTENVQENIENAVDSISQEAKYINYRLDKLKNTTDRVKYTIDFALTKEDGNWSVDDIDDITRQKIHGLYEH